MGAMPARNRTLRVRIVILLGLFLPVAPAGWTQAVAGVPGRVSPIQPADSTSCGLLPPQRFGGGDSVDIQYRDPKSERLETRLVRLALTVPHSSCRPAPPRAPCGNRGPTESS